ncbi:MAG: bifunctional folylpolyglutamate synthase/dihydrofolate synthase [Clostridia bacterium]|nr:bifunctional folylpolyglutamate synthase/dihydrofolate synthase [Clostridia bacterium]
MGKFINYANSFQAIARLELECIKRLCELLGNPQNDLNFIHIAGTNGKGSVCAMLQTALTHAGYKTGKYTSPNLISVCERISIDGVDITNSELENIMAQVQTGAEIIHNETGAYPTQFELWTAAAFLYFNQQKVDIVVLETGLGGERDATNVILASLVSVITPISFDHISYLGNDIKDIAAAKAGIIKGPKGVTVCANQPPEIMEVITKKALETNNELIIADKIESKTTSSIYEVFDFDDIKDITCGLGGIHQLENASIAITVLKKLGIDNKSIKYGIKNAKNPARFEMLSKQPLVIFDGAHNLSGAQVLSASLERYFKGEKFTFVLAFMKDKDYTSMIEFLIPFANRFIATEVPENPRALDAETLCQKIQNFNKNASFKKDVFAALDDAFSDEKVVICGSLYLYSFIKDYFSQNPLQ